MKGLELSKRFYLEYGEPMLRERFADVLPLIAVGLMGSGSECFGYDDEVSQDHDFEPGFCIMLPDEDLVDRKTAFAMERAYAKLPQEFMGYRRAAQSPVGGNRHGIIRMSEFFTEKTGTADGSLSLQDWITLPEQSLAEATNGRVFFDGLGALSDIRARLSYLPEDVRRKKLAGELLLMGQSGQYNFARCIERGEPAAAQLAVFEFVKSAMHAIFLLNKRYQPYYKWSFCALRSLSLLSDTHPALETLISTGNTATEVAQKQALIEDVCTMVAREAQKQGLSSYKGTEAEGHAYAVNASISDAELRNLHVLSAV